MTLEDLNNNYTSKDLFSFPGDPELRRTLFAPFLVNLYENKIVFYERFMCVARIEELVITPEKFKARAKVHLRIEKQSLHPINWVRLGGGWTFEAKWDWLSFAGTSFSLPYTSVVFWTDPQFVQMIEGLVMEQNHHEAVKLIFESI